MRVLVDEDDFEGDSSFESADSLADNELIAENNTFDNSVKHCDRSFKNVYVGYDEGIDLNALDNTANWQFKMKCL